MGFEKGIRYSCLKSKSQRSPTLTLSCVSVGDFKRDLWGNDVCDRTFKLFV